ncbi:polysaccharide pyruvyl transferase family protein [Shouchella clausii]|uniref:polysaccharide pyruvyl transferase family protein n=1 Tax=Shouchella clausii TaxID=79880 RepID=UPI0039835137
MSKKYIAIVGGELFNKGAQAMTFTVINEMKDKYPDAEILLLSSMDYERSEEDKANYKFEILRWSIKDKISIVSGKQTHLREKLKKTILIFDISGFALSSQRGFKPSVQYLLNIHIAKKFNIPMYLMPQSFGPFNYSMLESFVIKSMMKKLLRYPIVFAREEAGLAEVKDYNKNVKRSYDLVLQSSKEYDLEKIYHKIPNEKPLNIDEETVAIVPNMKLYEQGESPELLEQIYRAIIVKLLELEKKVLLLSHSTEDMKICKSIKNLFPDNKLVNIHQEEINCVNIDRILNKVDFIIASRYHSIIHAYKNNTPAIVIGWAVKYDELLSTFGQERYLFQIKKSIDINKIVGMTEYLNLNQQKEKEKIRSKLLEVQTNNVFDSILSKDKRWEKK